MSAPSRVHPLFLLGARGLLAGEFLRLLAEHPQLELAGAYARQGQGCLADHHPHLHGTLAEQAVHDAAALPQHLAAATQAPVLLLALPHGSSGPWWQQHGAQLEAAQPELTVVDLSADFRLSDAPAPWRYALPELHPVPTGSRRLAAPGCFATALQLAIVPLARAGILRPGTIFAHGVTGSSGSGAQPKAGTHHPHRSMNFHAYALQGHRHEAEVIDPRNELPPETALDFTPHSAPLSRGLHVHAMLPAQPDRADEAPELVRAFADAHPFIEASADAPQLRQVVGSNRAQLHAYRRGDFVHSLVAIDNTLKGGAGQALQALNLALDLPQSLALPSCGLGY